MNCAIDRSGRRTRCLTIALMVAAGVAALGGVVMLLWNCLLPDLFIGAQPVSYWQALGVLLLSKILFGSFRGGCHRGWGEHRHGWENLNPEERERLRSQFRGRWSRWCRAEKRGDDSASKEPSRGE